MRLFRLAGSRPKNLGVEDQRLRPCPESPNCVSSDDEDRTHAIAPFELSGEPSDIWPRICEQLASAKDAKIVTQADDYLHIEFQSKVFGFVDDLELHLRPEKGLVAVRSASRLGYSDLGANRKRVEALRTVLARQGLLR